MAEIAQKAEEIENHRARLCRRAGAPGARGRLNTVGEMGAKDSLILRFVVEG
jgi:hypothetical protein